MRVGIIIMIIVILVVGLLIAGPAQRAGRSLRRRR